MKYFVKDLKAHKYPVPARCRANHADEPLIDIPPPVFDKCEDCFGSLR